MKSIQQVMPIDIDNIPFLSNNEIMILRDEFLAEDSYRPDEDKNVNRYFLTFTSLGQSFVTNVIEFKPTDNLIDESTDQAA